jgi:hypothetical protein
MIPRLRGWQWSGLRLAIGGLRADFDGSASALAAAAETRGRCCSDCGAGLRQQHEG